MWNDDEVPESYLDVVVGYLSTIVGGARTALVERARKEIVGTVPEVEAEVETKEETTEATAEGDAAEPTPTEDKAEDATPSQPAAVPVPDPVRSARATKLLNALDETP